MLTIYKSSAGSGKTFTLVKEYLRLALPNPSAFHTIVAITFTNAAAAEMKERIISRLSGLANGTEENLAKLLLEEGLTKAQLKNAPKLLENILCNYSRFAVSTIDSFFHKILRTFGKELSLPLDFGIFLENDEALDYAVQAFMADAYSNPQIHALVMEYIEEKIQKGTTWNIIFELQKIARQLLKEASNDITPAPQEEVKLFIKELKQITNKFENGMDEFSQNVFKKMEAEGIVVTDFKYGRSGAIAFFFNCSKEVRDYKVGTRFLNCLESPENWIKKDSPAHLEDFIYSVLVPASEEAFDFYSNNFAEYSTAREVLRCIYTFSVYEEIRKKLIEYKEKNEVVLISDFTQLLAKHIKDEKADYIFSKLGARYNHLLIDEFQDTSSMQWMNLLPLVENSVSQGLDCLVVGDAKQAIYRWRGGEVELIETHLADRDLPGQTQSKSLSGNFRSRKEIVEFNNNFFTKANEILSQQYPESGLMQQIFEGVAQIPQRKDEKEGLINLEFIPAKKEESETLAKEKMLSAILENIAEGYTYKDLVILVRNKKDAAEVSAFMAENKLPFVSQDSLYLDQSPTIRLLLSMFKYINTPADNFAKMEAGWLWNSAIKNTPKPLPDFLQQSKTPSQKGGFKMEELRILPVNLLLCKLMQIAGLDQNPDAYLCRFREIVFDYVKNENHGLSAFLNWWKEGKFSVVMPEAANAIRVMTIHKSKGLEFPVVIMPFVDWDFSSKVQDIAWVSTDKEPYTQFGKLPVYLTAKLAETYFADWYTHEQSLIGIDNLNLLYVAFTRAKDKLYAFMPEPSESSGGEIKKANELVKMVQE
ncbi:MAG: UvrD-helicase domain-containing protein [Bacteroidetes bacterium]|nr:UvrD-helicase domain-containing protein [Bacteroidota bacterium]